MNSEIKNNEILEMIINDMNFQETTKLQDILKKVNGNFKAFTSMAEESEDMNVYVEDSISVGNIIVKYEIANIRLGTKVKKISVDPDINFMIKFYNSDEVMNFKGSGIDHYLTYEEWGEIYELFINLIINHIDILHKLGEDKKVKPKASPKKEPKKPIFDFSSLFKSKKRYDDDYYDEDDDEYYDDDDEYYDD